MFSKTYFLFSESDFNYIDGFQINLLLVDWDLSILFWFKLALDSSTPSILPSWVQIYDFSIYTLLYFICHGSIEKRAKIKKKRPGSGHIFVKKITF